jgi:hypothetical protein
LDFFISYTKVDVAWAEWIAWQLEAAGYTTVIQAWDFRPGSNFVLEMDRASREAEQTIAVLSLSYLDMTYTHPEWARAFAKDPKGEKSLLLPVRVLDCQPEGLLAQVVYIDLVGLDEENAKDRLLAQVRSGRGKPRLKPLFPGTETSPKPAFPAATSDDRQPNSAEREEARPAPVATPPAGAAARSPGRQHALDAAVLRKAEQELAKHMGPIAPRLVRKAATQATTPEELYESLAAKLRNLDERQNFLRRVSGARDGPATATEPAGTFDPSVLARARDELTKYLGPIAQKEVDKAARAATTTEDFYRRLASYLRTEAERNVFLEQMVSR